MSKAPRSMPYGLVPRVVIEDPELSHGAFRTYAACRLWVNRNTGVAFPKVSTLAKLLNRDRRQIQRWIVELEARGHIVRDPKWDEKRGAQTSNTYLFPSFPKVGGAVKTTAGGAVESAGGPAVKRTAPNEREVEVEKLNILSGTEGSNERSSRLSHGEDTSLHCIIPGCTEEQQSQGACYVHYGDPLHEKLIGRPAK